MSSGDREWGLAKHFWVGYIPRYDVLQRSDAER